MTSLVDNQDGPVPPPIPPSFLTPASESGLIAFSRSYAGYHGYISCAICLLGVLSNAFIVVVLTRRHMVNSTNLVLTALALTDMLTMMSYIPFALQFYCLHGTKPSPARNTLPWVRYCLFHVHFSVTTHTVSIWLGVVLSVLRYCCCSLSSPLSELSAAAGSRRRALRCTVQAIVAVYVASVLCLVPTYLTIVIAPIGAHGGAAGSLLRDGAGANESAEVKVNSGVGGMSFDSSAELAARMGYDALFDAPAGGRFAAASYSVAQDFGEVKFPLESNRKVEETAALDDTFTVKPDDSVKDFPGSLGYELRAALDTTHGRVIQRVNFWVHALVIKMLPCALMSVFGMLIVCAVRATHLRAQKLRVTSTRRCTESSAQRERDHLRTTCMLVVVIVLFLVTELPQGILTLLSGIKTEYFTALYDPLGDLMDIVALINNGINFTLYCTMSKDFRRTFLALFCLGRMGEVGEGGEGKTKGCVSGYRVGKNETVCL